MELLKDDFQAGEPVSKLGASWFNTVAQFINKLTGKRGVKVTRFGQFPTVELDLQNSGEKTTPTPTAGLSESPDFRNTSPYDEHYLRYLDGSDYSPYSWMTGSDGTSAVGWERGKTAYINGHDVDEDHPAVGCSMTVISHLYVKANKLVAAFSRMDFDENGLLVRVVPCEHWVYHA